MEVLAHAGPGSTWQAMVSAVAVGLVLVVVLVAAGRLELRQPGDLVLPLAGVAILSSLAPLGDVWLSDWVGWAFPVGVVALASLLLSAFTPLRLAADGALLYVAGGLAVVGALLLYRPLTLAWHPPPELLPDPGPTAVTILEPTDGAQVEAGDLGVEVAVEQGSIGPGRVLFDDLPWDPAEQGVLEVTVAGDRVEVEPGQDCPAVNPCREVSFTVEVPAGRGVGLQVEFRRGDGMPFSPAVLDRIEVDAR